MDASRTLITKNNKGAVVIFTAIFLMLVVSAILLVAVDFGFMYVNKAKLQNAADAGALAGAGRLKSSPFSNYTLINSIPFARNSARQFALENFNLPGMALNDSSNAADGDIVVGTWDPYRTPKFNAVTLSAYSSINAVKVTARRTGQSGSGVGESTRFPLFFGKYFGNIFSFSNTSTMGAKATAIAWRPPRARTYMMIGRNVCYVDFSSLPPPYTYIISPQVSNLAWTSLLTPSTNANDVQNDFFCPSEKIPFEEVCGKAVYTSGGTINSVFQSVEVDFNDPEYDTLSKTFATDTDGNPYVASWTVIVPVSEEADPTTQPVPHNVWGYAEITIVRACGSGGGNPCGSSRQFYAPNSSKVPEISRCYNNTEIAINYVNCKPCSESSSLFGAKPVLAQ